MTDQRNLSANVNNSNIYTYILLTPFNIEINLCTSFVLTLNYSRIRLQLPLLTPVFNTIFA